MAKPKYIEDFKLLIVSLNTAGSSVEESASEYSLSPQTIYKWKKLYTPNPENDVTEAEFPKMKKNLQNLRKIIPS